MPGTVPATREDDQAGDRIRRAEDKVNILYNEIVGYLREIHVGGMTPEESDKFVWLVSAANNLEAIGTLVAMELPSLTEEARLRGIPSREALAEMYRNLLGAVREAVEEAVRAVERDDQQAAQDVLTRKDDVHRMVDQALHAQVQALTAAEPRGVDAFLLEMEALDRLKRIARSTLPERLTAAV